MKLAMLSVMLLATLLCSPALAQFELDPPKGYEESLVPDKATILLDPLMLNESNPPDFYFKNPVGIQCRLGWSANSSGQDQINFLDPTNGEPLLNSDKSHVWSLFFAVYGLNGNRLQKIQYSYHGDSKRTEEIEFPPLSAEYVWLVDLTGNGRNEIVISGMTGISNGGGAYVFRMNDDDMLEAVSEGEDGELWPQMLWSFYGSMDLLRTDDGRWVFRGISPVGRNLTEYFWSWFYEWDESSGRFVMDGPSYHAEKKRQYEFFRRFHTVLKYFLADPNSFRVEDPALDYYFGFSDDYGEYSLDCFLEEDGELADWLVQDTITELDYMLLDPADGSDRL